MDRRTFMRRGGAALGLLVPGCRGAGLEPGSHRAATRLTSRPRAPTRVLSPGTHDLFAAIEVPGQLYIPAAEGPRPLVLMLHGAGASRDLMHHVFPVAEANGVIIATPRSMFRTWDLILGQPGVDVTRLDTVLRYTFANCAVQPAGVMLAGFSDGGSYALSIGLRNGDLFTHAAAFAPGFMLPEPRVGRPRIFLSHGNADEVLPAHETSGPIRDRLVQLGYDVEYRSFEGGHVINLTHFGEALQWLQL